uniref:Uncharacterized protein n=1 Tax=Cricetulus griseus TaxID=10029 RepID=A0A8C2M3S9_CRIGR
MYWFSAKLCLGSDQSPSIIYLSSFPWEAPWSSLHPWPDPLDSLCSLTLILSRSLRAASSPPPARAESWDGISANRQWLSDPPSYKQRVLEKVRRND